MTLAEFLTARLSDAEKMARYADADLNQRPAFEVDPEWALAVVEAARKILAEHHPTDWTAYGDHMCFRCVLDDDEVLQDEHHWLPWPCPTVRALAAVWCDHPDYDPAWSPGERMTP
jgi:hypothetical protein